MYKINATDKKNTDINKALCAMLTQFMIWIVIY